MRLVAKLLSDSATPATLLWLPGLQDGDFPQAEGAARETLALPCFPELTEAQQNYVVEVISKFTFKEEQNSATSVS
jgi:dTDP-4-amino-4,6-dideoxygalactose transaminase